jgi:putative salt-induced outer membrane protein YdiY
MINARRALPTFLACLLGSARAFAQAQPTPPPVPPEPPPPPPSWTGNAALSFLNTSGNTDTYVFGIGADAKYKSTSPWSLALRAAFAKGEADDVETMKKFDSGIRVGRALGARTDAFADLAYLEDIYAGIDARYGAEAGVSHKLTTTGRHLLAVEGALGVIHEVRLPLKEGSDFGTARAGLDYKFVISKTAEFQNVGSFTLNLSEGDDWRIANKTSLTATISTHFSTKLSYTVAHLNTPPFSKKKTDATAAAALVAKF